MSAITTNLLKLIIADQREEEVYPANYYHRTMESKVKALLKSKEITVLTGLRRSGKSVLLHFARKSAPESDYYFNFEDERLATFTSDDFQMLYEVFIELYGVQKIFYFDEIQNIPGWEMFVRRLYNAGNKIIITGSNSTLFSEELGTRLTGRYLSVKVYPFSFLELLQYHKPEYLVEKLLSTKQVGEIKKHFSEYVEYGGIPEYFKNRQTDYLDSLYESILYRDIIARYSISNPSVLKQLVFYLASNCSKEVTYNSLRKLLGLGSATTVSDYCGYLENSYLCTLVSRYSASVKVQQQSPKKVYFIDHALAKRVGFRFSQDRGRMLENIVFIELKRRNLNVFYHSDTKECDFVIQEGVDITMAIQVTQDISNPETKQREFNGVLEAMQTYSLNEGYILTESSKFDEIVIKNGAEFIVHVCPVWKWLIMSHAELAWMS